MGKWEMGNGERVHTDAFRLRMKYLIVGHGVCAIVLLRAYLDHLIWRGVAIGYQERSQSHCLWFAGCGLWVVTRLV